MAESIYLSKNNIKTLSKGFLLLEIILSASIFILCVSFVISSLFNINDSLNRVDGRMNTILNYRNGFVTFSIVIILSFCVTLFVYSSYKYNSFLKEFEILECRIKKNNLALSCADLYIMNMLNDSGRSLKLGSYSCGEHISKVEEGDNTYVFRYIDNSDRCNFSTTTMSK